MTPSSRNRHCKPGAQPDGAHSLFSVIAVGLLELGQLLSPWAALAAGALAPLHQAPLLLVQPCAVPSVVREQLSRLNPERVVLLGGAGTICDSAEQSL